jgi:tol-pal system protein YbgF
MARMKAATSATLVAVAALSQGGCFASKSDVAQLRDEVSQIRNETATVDSVRAMQMVQLLSSLRAMNDTLASISTRITRVRAESQSGMRDLNTQLVQLQEATGQSQARIQEMRAAIEARNRVVVPPPPPPPSSDTTRRDTVNVPPLDQGPGPNELFQLGRDQLARGAISAARAAFADLLAKYPDSDLAPDAQFYLAEALAAEGKTSSADTAYATVVKKYPQSLRAATAMYKRGVAQQKGGKTATARKTFNDLIKMFPESDEAALARERLRAMS